MTTMLKMRLQRIGRKNDPHARIIVTDSRQGPKSGRYLEIVGSYNMKGGIVEIKKDRVLHWLSVGVQPSITVHNLLVTEKIIDAPKKNALPKKTALVKEAKEEENTEEAKKEEPEDKVEEEVTTESEDKKEEAEPVAELEEETKEETKES